MKRLAIITLFIFWTVFVGIIAASKVFHVGSGKNDSDTAKPQNITLTKDVISKHNSKNDCWMIIDNKVYDLTKYFGKHPGDDSTILKYCGKDGTSGWTTKDKVVAAIHSVLAKTFLDKYFIGDLGQVFGSDDVSVPNPNLNTQSQLTTSTQANANVALTWAEIVKHNSAFSCWLVVNGNVYDVTRYPASHPGGTAYIYQYCGKEATSAFTQTPHPHSGSATSLLSGYFIGKVGQTASVSTTSPPPPTNTLPNSNEEEEDD